MASLFRHINLGLAIVTATLISTTAHAHSAHRHKTHASYYYHSVEGYSGGNYTIYSFNRDLDVINPYQYQPHFIGYVYPKNTPKYDNRLHSHAQEWLDANLKNKQIYI